MEGLISPVRDPIRESALKMTTPFVATWADQGARHLVGWPHGQDPYRQMTPASLQTERNCQPGMSYLLIPPAPISVSEPTPPGGIRINSPSGTCQGQLDLSFHGLN